VILLLFFPFSLSMYYIFLLFLYITYFIWWLRTLYKDINSLHQAKFIRAAIRYGVCHYIDIGGIYIDIDIKLFMCSVIFNFPKYVHMYLISDHSGRVVWGTNCHPSLEFWESHSSHGHLCTFILFVLFSVLAAALRRADPPCKEPYRLCKQIKKLKSVQGPKKGCRAIGRQINM
jgi:hypothetical protein